MHGRRLALLFAAIATALAGAGCDRLKALAAQDDDASASASAAAASASATPKAASSQAGAAKNGCTATTPGGTFLANKLEPGLVTVAAVHGKALVVNQLYKDAPQQEMGDALESAKSERVVLGANGAPEAPMEPVSEGHAKDESCCPLTWSVATPFESELTTMTLATARFAAAGCGGGTLFLKRGASPARTMAGGYCKFASVLAGAAKGDFAIGVADGPLPQEVAEGWPSAVDALVFAGGKSKNVRLETIANAPGAARVKLDVPAVAVTDQSGTVAWRVARGGTKELHVARLDRAGTKAKNEVLERGAVGAPTLAYDGDDVQAVWASRAKDGDPYVLHAVKWSGSGAPGAPATLPTNGGSTYAPGLAMTAGRVVLAWMEGDDKTGVVKAGAGATLAAAVAHAVVVSNAGTNARDPEVAVDKDGLFVVWQEFSGKKAELRATTLACSD